jgi:glycosyltransferase involved in cell wall biosynthesis
MKSVPEISVVMANYNGARYLEAAVESIQNQSLKSWELIIVDDASQDDSVALATRLSEGDRRVSVMRQTANRGPAAARNRAFDVARGQWIAVFDSDDIMLPRRLETLRDRAKTDKAPIVADNLLVFSDNIQAARPFLANGFGSALQWVSLAGFIESNRLYSRTPDLGYLKPFINAATLRSSGISYDERLHIGEDYDFMARLLAHGMKLRLESSALYLYRKHAQSTSHRIRGEDIVALIDADERLARDFPMLKDSELRALHRRRQSLTSMLLYDRIVVMIKTRQYAHAAALSFGAPRVWPLLTRPFKARWNRLFSRDRRPKADSDRHSLERQ